MKDTLTLKDSTALLDYKDQRSTIKWCRNNNVKIFALSGSKKKYVMKLQFEYARLKDLLDYLKKEFKEDWENVYKVYNTYNLLALYNIKDVAVRNRYIKKNCYKTKGQVELRILSLLTNINPEL